MPIRLPVLSDDPAEEWTGDTRSCPPPDEPCPWVRCRHHALSEVTGHGVLVIGGKALSNRATRAEVVRFMARAVRLIEEAAVTCTLKAAKACRWYDEEIADALLWDVTVVRQRANEGIAKMRDPLAAATDLEPLAEGWRTCRRCARPFKGDGIMCSQRCRAKARLAAYERQNRKGRRRR